MGESAPRWGLACLLVVLAGHPAWAASLNAFVGGQLYAGGTVSFSGTVSPAGVYAVTLTVWDTNTGQAVHQADLNTDENGFFSRQWSDFNPGDYNVLVDTNADLNAAVFFSVAPFAGVDLNWVGGSPPFQKNASLVFNLQPKDAAGSPLPSYRDLNVALLNARGAVLDQNEAVKKRGDANRTWDVNFQASETGTLFVSVNGGAKTFPVAVYAFRLFATAYDSDGNPQDFFATGQTVTLKARVTSFDKNTLYTGNAASLDGNIEAPDGNVHALSFSTVRGLYQATFTPSATGTHTVRLRASVGSDTQTLAFTFNVQTHRMHVSSKKNQFAGSKERFPAVFAPDQNALFHLTFTRLSDEAKLTGSDLNGLCEKARYTVTYAKAGSATTVRVSDSNLSMAQTSKGCDVNVTAPHAPGTYTFSFTGKGLNFAGALKTLQADVTVVIQPFVVFMDAVDPATFASDPRRAKKFTFFKDENVGFTPSVIGLKPGLSGAVSQVRGVTLLTSAGETPLAMTRFDYNADTNLLTIAASAFTDHNVSDGIVPVQFSVDIDAPGTANDVDGLSAFGGLRFKTMDITVEPATNASGEAKNEEFGPAIFAANDDNVYLKVTVKDAAGTGVRFASVKVKKIRNVEFWEEVDVNHNTPVLTDSDGVAVLDVGRLPSGGFLVEVQASKDGKTGVGEAFLVAKNFLVFGEPVAIEATPEGRECSFQSNLGTGDDVNLLLGVMDPFDFNPVGDYTVTSVKLFKESDLGAFEKPTLVDVNYAVQEVRCRFFAPAPEDFNLITFSAPSGGWETGFYRASIAVASASKGSETGVGFFQVLPFFFEVTPLGQQEEGPGGGHGEAEESVEPGAWFDFSVTSGHDVNLEATLEREDTFQEIEGAALPLRLGATDLNAVAGFDVSAETPATVRVNIPHGLAPGNYLLNVTGTDENGNEAEGELFLKVAHFGIVVARSTYWQNAPNELRYKQAGSGQLDTNIMDDLLGRARYASTADVGSLAYDRWIDNDPSTGQVNDWNRLILVDTASHRIYIDLTDDGNFLNDMDGNAAFSAVPGQYLQEVDLVARDGNGGYLADGNHPLLTAVTFRSRQSLRYVRYPHELALQQTGEQWLGVYDLDRNIMLPLLVKRPSGAAVEGATVAVTKVFKVGAGFGPPTPLPATQWSAFSDTTDANGLALPVLRLRVTGTFMVELSVTSGGTTLYFFPWQGPVFQTAKFQSTAFLAKPGRVVIDFSNPVDASFDFTGLPPGTVYDDNYGFFSEADHNYDLDNDGDADENWYFLRVKPGGFLGDANLIVDDDKNFDFSPGSFTDSGGGEGGESMEALISLEPWAGCLADYAPATGRNDCNAMQGRYWLAASDANALDNNAVLEGVIVYEPSGSGSYELFWNRNQPNAADRNVHGLVEVKALEGGRAATQGTVTATLFAVLGQDRFAPVGTFSASFEGGVAKVGFGDLNTGTYEAEYDLNFSDGNTQQTFSRFRVR